MSLAVVCCLHGNEKYGLKVIKKISPIIPFFIANKRAVQENKRFIDEDLNRCFPGKSKGNHEEKIAFNLLPKLKKFDFVLDLHSSSENCPLFGIITKPDHNKLDFAKKLGLKKLVIMPDNFSKSKSLIDHLKCGISIEVGNHKRSENPKEVIKCIHSFFKKKNSNQSPELFEVINIIEKKEENVRIDNFEKIKKGQIISSGRRDQLAEFDFTAVLVNEKAYDKILCLACRQVNLKDRDALFQNERKI
ncbi:MAG: succinylglutamate desuccinylase/aspartoacylase family protein [Nanoarchaeota archaeon]|nr:succinylglutamate desuccinylase/aspartoacylase family protein [Nanoarchaeota archaeon]